MTPADILAIRSALGWPQQRLADALGVTVRTVKHWEAGTRNPSGPALVVLRQLQEKRK